VRVSEHACGVCASVCVFVCVCARARARAYDHVKYICKMRSFKPTESKLRASVALPKRLACAGEIDRAEMKYLLAGNLRQQFKASLGDGATPRRCSKVKDGGYAATAVLLAHSECLHMFLLHTIRWSQIPWQNHEHTTDAKWVRIKSCCW